MPGLNVDLDDSPIIIGNDHTPRLTGITDADGVAITDWTGWSSVTWFLRVDPDFSNALLEIPATRVNNTWIAPITDDQTSGLRAGTMFYSWKRMDSGLEADLAYGKQPVVRTASR